MTTTMTMGPRATAAYRRTSMVSIVPLLLITGGVKFVQSVPTQRFFHQTTESISQSATTLTDHNNLFATRNDVSTMDLRQAISPCTLSDGGFYGSISGTARTIEFLYQANVVQGTSSTDVRSDLLPMMDRQLVQGILPLLFPDQCSGRLRNLRAIAPREARKLQGGEPKIIGIGSQILDLATNADDLPCAVANGGDCYTIQGYMTAFAENVLTDDEASELVLPAIQAYLKGGLTTIDPRIISVNYVVRDETNNNGGGSFLTVQPVPTPAPNVFQPTQSPIVATAEPGAPTRIPIAIAPTRTPITFPFLTPAPIAPGSSASPVATGTTLTPVSPSSPTLAPISGGSFQPTFAPLFVQPTPDPFSAELVGRSSESGIDKMEWWMWLLVAVGAVALCGCGFFAFGGARGGAPKPQRMSPKNKEDAEPYVVSSPEEYVPPGLGTFNTASVSANPVAATYGLKQDEENYDNNEDDDNYDDDEEDDVETYEEGEDEFDEEEESYEEEEGTLFEEESYYEEESGGNEQQRQPGWNSGYSVTRSKGSY